MKDVEGREMRPKWEDSEEQVILFSIILDYTNMATKAV